MRPRRNRQSRWQHGTRSGYLNHGCRCDACRSADRAYYEANKDRIAENKRAYREAHPGWNAAACKRSRERRKALAPRETRKLCDVCGIGFDRAKRTPGTNTCVDCTDVERGIA